MPALQALTGGKLLFSPCNPFSAFYAYSGAAAPSNALSREWWGFAPHPTSFCAKRKRKTVALRAEMQTETRPTNSNLPNIKGAVR